MPGKRCSGCGEVKGVEAFSRDSARKDGLQTQCKACKRRYYEENREAVLDQHRRYYEENREAELENKRRYYEENREAIRELNRRRYEENRDMTQETATRNGEPYTPAEDAHILTSDEPIAVIAVELGRTLNSVRDRRRKLRKAVTG